MKENRLQVADIQIYTMQAQIQKERMNRSTFNTIYIGDPHKVAAMTPSSRNRAKPKSAEAKYGQ